MLGLYVHGCCRSGNNFHGNSNVDDGSSRDTYLSSSTHHKINGIVKLR